MTEQREYRVAYVIDVDATSHREAAEVAADLMKDAAQRGHYQVNEHLRGPSLLGPTIEVDLETDEEHEPRPGTYALRVREDGLYTLPGLKAHDENAFEQALANLDAMLWEDGANRESVGEVIAFKFGEKVGDPAQAQYGPGDYPGVPGVQLTAWELERGAFVALDGTLTRENAPALPWNDWIEEVRLLSASRMGTVISVEESDTTPYHGSPELTVLLAAMEEAVQDALGEALSAGQKEAEYRAGEENLLELAEANEWLFTEHGDLA